jgi:hypothetical protein
MRAVCQIAGPVILLLLLLLPRKPRWCSYDVTVARTHQKTNITSDCLIWAIPSVITHQSVSHILPLKVLCYLNFFYDIYKLYFSSNKLTNLMEQFYKFITWRFVALNMFRAPPRPTSGAYKCINSLWFYRWSMVVAVLLVMIRPRLTTLLPPRSNGKTSLLMQL